MAAGNLDFGVEALLAEACAATGLSDFGERDFREPLGVLCQTYQRAAYDERGRKRNRRRVLQLLTSRLRVEAALRRHPEIRQREIRRPMVLTGLPRSGTSALFNLLAVDPEARPLLLWETQHPDPVEGLAPGQPDPRYLAVKAYYEEAHQKNPEFTKMHLRERRHARGVRAAPGAHAERRPLRRRADARAVRLLVPQAGPAPDVPLLPDAAPDARLAAARPALAAEGARPHVGDRRADRDLPGRLGGLEPPRSAALHRLDLQHDLGHPQRRAPDLEAGAGPGGVRLLRDLARARTRGARPQRHGSLRRRHARRLRGGFAGGGAPHLRPLRAAALEDGRGGHAGARRARTRRASTAGTTMRSRSGDSRRTPCANASSPISSASTWEEAQGERRSGQQDRQRAGVDRILRAAQEGRRHDSARRAGPFQLRPRRGPPLSAAPAARRLAGLRRADGSAASGLPGDARAGEDGTRQPRQLLPGSVGLREVQLSDPRPPRQHPLHELRGAEPELRRQGPHHGRRRSPERRRDRVRARRELRDPREPAAAAGQLAAARARHKSDPAAPDLPAPRARAAGRRLDRVSGRAGPPAAARPGPHARAS